MDFLYSSMEGRSSSVTDPGQEYTSDTLRQQYNLTLLKRIYPSLTLFAGGIVEKSRSSYEAADTDRTTATTAYRPFVDLTLRSPFVTAGAGYSRQQTTTGATDGPMRTLVQDRYSAVVGWQREQLPSVSVRWEKTQVGDRAREEENQAHEMAGLVAKYEPLPSLQLRYEQTRDDTQNKIDATEVQSRTTTGRADFSESWLDSRIGLFLSYAASRRRTEIVESATGLLDLQLYPFRGLFAVDDTPATGALDAAFTLIDGDTATATGITIGLPVTVPGARNAGLDMGSATTMNLLALWVSWNNTSLPSVIAGSFTWDLYTGDDNLTWTLQASNVAATFDTFRNRFELVIPEVTARYVKLVVNPLTPAQALASPEFAAAADQQIHVTELQVFRRTTPDGPVITRTRSANGSFRAVLLQTPLLTYDLNYGGFISETDTTTRQTTVSNGLSLSYRFSPKVAWDARAARQDSSDPQGTTITYLVTAGTTVTPLPVLTHVLSYSGRASDQPETDSVQHSVFLSNTASLYHGLDVSASGGVSHGRDSTGLRTDSRTFLAGAMIAPRKDLTISPSYSVTVNELSGAGHEPTVEATRRADLSASSTPTETLYLTASWGWITQAGVRHERVKAYNASWSPFRGGALQLSVHYAEDRRSTEDSINRLLTSGARWNISRSLNLTATVSRSRNTSTLQQSRTTTASTELRYLF